MVDVDRFKDYNDTFGHPGGDEVLKRVAAILHDGVRQVGEVARYGGEEFAILLPDTAAGRPAAWPNDSARRCVRFAGRSDRSPPASGVATTPPDSIAPTSWSARPTRRSTGRSGRAEIGSRISLDPEPEAREPRRNSPDCG